MVQTYPRVKYISASTNQIAKHIYVSRTSTVREFHFTLCQAFCEGTEYTAEELMDLSRIWTLTGGDTFDDCKQMLYDNKDMSKLPLDIEAKVLPADKTIDECNVAD